MQITSTTGSRTVRLCPLWFFYRKLTFSSQYRANSLLWSQLSKIKTTERSIWSCWHSQLTAIQEWSDHIWYVTEYGLYYLTPILYHPPPYITGLRWTPVDSSGLQWNTHKNDSGLTNVSPESIGVHWSSPESTELHHILTKLYILYHFIQFGSHTSQGTSKCWNVMIVTAIFMVCRIHLVIMWLM